MLAHMPPAPLPTTGRGVPGKLTWLAPPASGVGRAGSPLAGGGERADLLLDAPMLPRHRLRLRDVGGDLGAEGVEGGEALLVAEAVGEEEADGAVAQVAGEV